MLIQKTLFKKMFPTESHGKYAVKYDTTHQRSNFNENVEILMKTPKNEDE